MERCIAVIGGGVSEVAAAYRSPESHRRANAVVLEAGTRVGGVLETKRRDGFLLESAADRFLVLCVRAFCAYSTNKNSSRCWRIGRVSPARGPCT